MKKLSVVLLVMLFAVPAFAEKSDNISLTEGWVVWYEKGFSDEPVTFHFENISGQTAFKITVVIYCYDSSGKYIDRAKIYEPGPIHRYFGRTAKIPRNIYKMTAEVFNTWEYNP